MVRERDRRPSFDIFVVCIALILSGGWWHAISFFFVILFEGRRRRGEFQIGLIVLAKSKPRESISSCGFRVCSVWVVGELVPGFLLSVLSGVCGGALLWGWSAALTGWLYFRGEPHHRCLAGLQMCPLVVGVVSVG